MRSFTLITSTPGLVATFLESRGIIKQGPDGYEGVLPGMEWVEVPNPIQTGVDGNGNPIMDTRHVYLVKFAHDSEAGKAVGFAQWMDANTTKVTAPANYTINGQPAGDAWKVNGQNVWLAKNDDRFGVWA